MNLTKLEFKKIFTPLTVIAVVVMLLLNLYMTFDYRAAYLLAALDPDSKSKPIETLKSEYAEKRGEITDEWIAARRSDVENILNDPKYLKTEDELKQYLSDLAAQGYPAEEIERLKSQPYTILNNNGITSYEHTEKFTHAASFYDNAEEEKQYLLDEYSSDADICADISARYDALINDYRAFCDYDLAYTSIQYVIANAFPFTVGVPVLIGLAPLFGSRTRAQNRRAYPIVKARPARYGSGKNMRRNALHSACLEHHGGKRGGILLHPLRRGGLRRILAVVYRHLLSVSVDDRAGDHS